VIISISAVLALSGCAVIKDINCGTQSVSKTGCSNAQLIEDEQVAPAKANGGKISPYGDLSQAYID
jgi:uncharacterized protein YceK